MDLYGNWSDQMVLGSGEIPPTLAVSDIEESIEVLKHVVEFYEKAPHTELDSSQAATLVRSRLSGDSKYALAVMQWVKMNHRESLDILDLSFMIYDEIIQRYPPQVLSLQPVINQRHKNISNLRDKLSSQKC